MMVLGPFRTNVLQPFKGAAYEVFRIASFDI
jgi:hypothetical protein